MNRSIFVRSLVFAFLASACVQATLLAGETPKVIRLSDDVLHDKIRGGIIGEIFGDLNGLPHEMKYIDSPGQVEQYTPSLPNGAWTDDDTDIEWVHHFYMDKTAATLLPYPLVAELWKRHINKMTWTANDYARRLMDLGIEPPYTGRIAINPVAVFNISGEFCAESFGLCAPAMPRTASKIGLHYVHITIDGEPAQQTQLFDTMIAMTFVESDINALIDAGAAALDPRSELVEVVRDTRAWCAANSDWHITRKLIHDKYTLHRNELPDRNGYQLNTAAVLAALIYGKGEYAQTIRMTFNFGWDADCTSATAGTIVGAIKGGRWFDEQIKTQGWTLKDVYRNTCRDNMPMDETITGYADCVYRIARRVIVEGGGEEGQVDGKAVFQIRSETPGNVELLPRPLERIEELRKELLPAIEKDLTGAPTDKARAAYLAICLDEAPRLAQARPQDWSAALAELKKHQSLINVMYAAPPSVAAGFQAKFKAAGVEKSKGELLKMTTQPNVLFIVIDDLNDWVGCLGGHPQARTPNIDRLAAGGTLFANAHVQAPLCNPSRASVLTGLRPSTTGIYGLRPGIRDVPALKGCITLPQYFARHDYFTASFGKVFHDGSIPRQLQANEFDVWGPVPGMPLPTTKFVHTPDDISAMDWGVFPIDDREQADWKTADNAISQLKARPPNKPFFLAVGFRLPHVPCFASQKWFDLIPDGDNLIVPLVKEHDRDDVPFFAWYLHWKLPEPRLSWLKHNQWRPLVRAYLASTTFMDSQIGRVLDALDSSGQASNTVIVLWSDNGWHLGEKAITGKNSLWERSTHVPLIFAGPGVARKGLCTQPAELLDIYPTLVELCGLPSQAGLEGHCLVPQLESATAKRPWPTITTHNVGNHAVRTDRWRYIRYANGAEELYDMLADPNEWTNLASDPTSKAVIVDLAAWLPQVNLPPVPGSADRILVQENGVWLWQGRPIKPEELEE